MRGPALRLAMNGLVFLGLMGCSDAVTELDAGEPDAGIREDTGPPDAGPPPPLALATTAFGDGEAVPQRHQCGPPLVPDGVGEDVTPALSWSGGPEAASYAVIVRDRSAGGLVHWVIYDIPGSTTAVDEGVPSGYEPPFPAGAKQAEIQGSGYFGYFGPCSGGRGNTYAWTVHALDVASLPDVDRGTPENDVAALVESISIASASFTGIY
ncbi:MAG: YbhB/YbcL family Raf kinase inhibitor-like protein [Sandaracinaceae bacterium]